MKEEREKLVVKGGVTRTTSRSRSPSIEVEKTKEITTHSREQCVEDKEGDWWNVWQKEERRSLR